MAQKQRTAIGQRMTGHERYRLNQRTRERIGEVLGSVKTVGGCRELRYCRVAHNSCESS